MVFMREDDGLFRDLFVRISQEKGTQESWLTFKNILIRAQEQMWQAGSQHA